MTAQPTGSSDGLTLMLIEGGVTCIIFAASFAWPRLGNSFFQRIESSLSSLAANKWRAVLSVTLCTLLIRLALLPIFPVPLPFVPDDFSNLLASQTFSLGRLTNPTPAMWIHFETIHVDMQPTYMSMYFPSLGMVMALGQILFGKPWFGILFASALMCGAITWMLQAWLPSRWALLGGFVAMLRLGLFSYWVNTYTGAGAIAALGGALILGAVPRLVKTSRFRYGLILSVGIVLVAFTRPYEGLLLCLPVSVLLGKWVFVDTNHPPVKVLLRRAAFPLLILVAAGIGMGYYNYRVFGGVTTLPYAVNRSTYAVAPYYIWQSQRPDPVYRHPEMRRFYYESEMKVYSKVHSLEMFIPECIYKLISSILFFAGILLLPPLLMTRRVFRDRRMRFLVASVLFLIAGLSIEIYLIPHYVAPFTSAFYALGLQATRHLRLWNPGGQPVGMALVRLTVTLCLILGVVRVFSKPLGIKVDEFPPNNWSGMWWGPDIYGAERAQIASQLEQLQGKQLVFVRPSTKRDPLDQWVYNKPDIDGAKVVWAWDMDAGHNQELMRYYGDRKAWLVHMDTVPAIVSAYSVQAQ
jgi:Uncharacterized conserved protein